MSPVRSICLPERMDATTLPALQSEILGCRGGDLDLDASRIGRFGGLAQQLILAAFKTWQADGCRLRLLDPTPVVCDAFDALGCTPHIETCESKA